MKNLIKDTKGILFSTDFLIGVLILVIIIGITSSILDKSNEKLLNSVENNYLEKISGETVDNLIKNPGYPENWDKLSNFNNVIPGLAIKNENNETLPNTISFRKINVLKNSYDVLIDKNIFNNQIKSSIAIYPLNSKITTVVIGDNENFNSIANVIIVNRTVKCDFFSDFVVLCFDGRNVLNDDLKDSVLCKHTFHSQYNESNQDYVWNCKSFQIKKSDLEYKNYYLLFDDESINIDSHWEIVTPNGLTNDYKLINSNLITLNSKLQEKLEDENEKILYLHLKIPNQKKNNFNMVLVGIPKEVEVENLAIEYFKEQECYFILKTCYQ